MMVSKVISASLVAYAVTLSTGSVAGQVPANSVAGVSSQSGVTAKIQTAKLVSWKSSMKAGRYQDATNALTRIIEDPKTPLDKMAMAYLNRALAHQQLRQHKQAISDYGKALALDALSPKVRAIALYNRGLANRKLKKPAPAIEDFTSALFLSTKFSHAYYSRANVMRSIGRHALALEDYKNALNFGYPTAHLPYFGMAVAFDAMKEPAKARQALSKVLEIKPGFKPAMQRYAELAGEPYHSSKPSHAAFAAPAKLPNTAKTKIATEPHSVSSAGQLPTATVPPRPYLSVSRQGEAGGSDTLTTASIATAASAQKLDHRFPGFKGSTAPVPQKSPGEAFVQNKPAESVTITPVAAQSKTEAPKKKAASITKPQKVRVASLNPVVANLPAKTISSGNGKGWLVQINSQRTEEAARATWSKLKRRHKKSLGGENAVFQQADLGKKGIYWRVRLSGFDGKSAARKKCASLKRSRIGCFVVRVK